MAGDMRKAWRDAKSNAEKEAKRFKTTLDDVAPFIGKEGLGPALDEAEEFIDKFDRENDDEEKHKMMKGGVEIINKARGLLKNYGSEITNIPKKPGFRTLHQPVLDKLDGGIVRAGTVLNSRSKDFEAFLDRKNKQARQA